MPKVTTGKPRIITYKPVNTVKGKPVTYLDVNEVQHIAASQIKPDDAVQIRILVNDEFAESLIVRVTFADRRSVIGYVQDEVLFPAKHDYRNNSYVRCEPRRLFNHWPNVTWREGKFYESPEKKQREYQEKLAS